MLSSPLLLRNCSSLSSLLSSFVGYRAHQLATSAQATPHTWQLLRSFGHRAQLQPTVHRRSLSWSSASSSSSMSNPYQVLGLKYGASAAEIKAAFLSQAKQSHPDMNPGDPNAGKRFAEVNSAYKDLTDPDRKARIDSILGGKFNNTHGSFHSDEESLDARLREAWLRGRREDWVDPQWRRNIRYTRVDSDSRQDQQSTQFRFPFILPTLLFLIAIQFMSGAYQQGNVNIIEKRIIERQLMRDRYIQNHSSNEEET